MFVNKIKKMLKKIENIEKEIEAKEKKLNKNIQDDLEKEKKIEKILEKEEKKLEKEEKNVKYYSEELENKEDEDKYNDYDNSEKKEIIEGFNNINYNDFIENKMKVASSTVYDTDFSNIYNTYVKDNLLDIQKVKENNDSIYNDTSFYLKSKCRGWKKKNKV
tara:strand:+ start:676 stop:1161 length:486 start_codon:yes stop_codon:yes gene_type:complete